MDNNLALINEFLIESFDNLSQINSKLFEFEKNPKDKEILNEIYRTIHTLKGSASFLGFKKLQEVTHLSESILDLIRSNKARLDSKLVDTLLKSFDFCNVILKNIEKTQKEGDVESKELSLLLLVTLERLSASDAQLIKTDKNFNKDLLKEIDLYAEVANVSEILPQVEEVKSVVAQVVAEPEHKDVKDTAITDSVVRVNVKLLDKIMNVVGELVLNRNQILQFSNKQDNPDLSRLTQQLDVITSELQNEIMLTRMQPIGSVLNKFDRVIRDLAKDQGKKIRLKISGQETELDKTLIEAIKDPLTHILRNAADHGLESPDERKVSGKNPEGTISIRAYHEGGQVNIEIADDGKGINKDKIVAKAIEKGLINKEQSLKLSESQILNLIFLPGFSTAEKITNISGRGVGMDVVKTNIEKIGGSVHIHSVLGAGTTFKLKIPLTLAIVPALMVQSKGETFAIPQINLVELVRLENREGKQTTEKIHDAEFFRLRGNLIPIFRLNDFLKLESVAQKSSKLKTSLYENKVYNQQSEKVFVDDALNVVILNAEGQIFGLVVDNILDTQEIVVKPLDRMLKDLSSFAGATVLGDGSVSLIIDALGFYNSTGYSSGKHQEIVSSDDQVQQNQNLEKQDLLLIKLEDENTYAIPLSLVSRLEEFKEKQLEFTGTQPIIRYLDKPLPLINIEKTLNLKHEWVLAQKSKASLISSVVVNIKRTNYGLVVKEIVDIALTDSSINSNVVDREGILGTVFVQDKIISLLDIYKLIELQHLGIPSQTNAYVSDFKSLKKYKVLLAEDSPLYRKMESDALNELGVQLIVAKDGAEAYDYLDKNGPVDLIVTDIEMPRLNGFELAQKIRANLKLKNIPIIAVSTKISEKDIQEGKKSGFDLHLEKLKKDELIENVQNYLR